MEEPFVDGTEEAFGGEDSDSAYFKRMRVITGVSNDEVALPANGEKKTAQEASYIQWAVRGNGRFSPVGSTTTGIPAGVYQPYSEPGEHGLQRMPLSSDGLYNLPDMSTQEVIKEVEMFWNSEPRYRQHNLLHKRGILLWGPPGSGKTVTVKMLVNELVKRDGIVILSPNPSLTAYLLKDLRMIEPKRSIIIVLEDIDEIISHTGESMVLSLLDGEHNVDNVLNIATTNYPDRLGARIINRPSRFDRRVFVGMPSVAARQAYLENATKGGLSTNELKSWVSDTDEMSIAHLRELVAAVHCLGQPYPDVLARLREMTKPIKVKKDGFAESGMGFK